MNTRFLAGGIATLWAAFWGYFATVAILFEPGDTLTRLKIAAFVVALLGSALWAAWTRKPAGNIWLCLIGAGLGIANLTYFHAQLFLFFGLALPPLAAGLLKSYPLRSALVQG